MFNYRTIFKDVQSDIQFSRNITFNVSVVNDYGVYPMHMIIIRKLKGVCAFHSNFIRKWEENSDIKLKNCFFC